MRENSSYPLPEDSDWFRAEFPEEARQRAEPVGNPFAAETEEPDEED